MKRLGLLLLLGACGEHGSTPTSDAPPVDAAPPPTLGVRWAVSIGSIDQDYLTSAVLDRDGNVLASYDIGANVDGNTRYTHSITKRAASDGSELWTRTFEPLDDNAYLRSIVETDANGSVYAASCVYRRVDLDGQVIGAIDDYGCVLIRFDSAGAPEWIRPITDLTFSPQISAVSVDASGRIYIVGTEHHPADDQDMDSFAAAFDPDGTQVWTRHFSAVGYGPIASSVAVDENGDVLIAGAIATPAEIAGSSLLPTSNLTPFLARLGRDGANVGANVLPGFNASNQTLAVMSERVFLQQVESTSVLVHSLDASGAADIWVQTLPGSRSITPQWRVLTTVDGSLVSAGWNDGPYNADHPTTVDGSLSVWVADADGRVVESAVGTRVLGGFNASMARAADATENRYFFGGEFGGSVDFGTGMLLSPGEAGSDIFLVVTDR